MRHLQYGIIQIQHLQYSKLFGDYNGTNKELIDFIAYLWHDVPGLQKFGTYEGNGSNNGPYIELGFRPAIGMGKKR